MNKVYKINDSNFIELVTEHKPVADGIFSVVVKIKHVKKGTENDKKRSKNQNG